MKKGAAPFRLGYADLSKVAAESAMGKVAKTHFEAKADKLKSQIDTKQNPPGLFQVQTMRGSD